MVAVAGVVVNISLLSIYITLTFCSMKEIRNEECNRYQCD